LAGNGLPALVHPVHQIHENIIGNDYSRSHEYLSMQEAVVCPSMQFCQPVYAINSVFVVVSQDNEVFGCGGEIIRVENYYLPIFVDNIATVFGNLIRGIESDNESP
jgi:hypothetical protein